jgi:hypothetical protein
MNFVVNNEDFSCNVFQLQLKTYVSTFMFMILWYCFKSKFSASVILFLKCMSTRVISYIV